MIELVIGRPGGDHVGIQVHGRMHAPRGDYWDDNWLTCRITAAVGGFTADYAAGFHSAELLRFRAGLARLHTELTGDATLESIEHWVALTVTCHRTGRLTVTGTLDDTGSGTTRLSLRLDDLDQSDLPGVLDTLAEIDHVYPVLGGPAT